MSTFSTNDSTVNSFYLAFYGRPADPAGLKFWSAQLAANNGDMGAIVDFFAASEEAQVRFGTDTVADRITEIYSQLFNRTPDADGMAFWTKAIEQGHASLADIAMSIQGGAQGSDATLSQLRKQAADAFTAKVDADGSEYSGYASIEAARILVRAVTADATSEDLNALVNAAVSFADTATKTPQVVEAIAVNTTLLALFDTARGVKEPVALAKALADVAKAAAGDPVTLESLLRGGGMDKVLKVMPAKATLVDVVEALAKGGLPAAVEVVYPTTPTAPTTPAFTLSFDHVEETVALDAKRDNVTNVAEADVTFKYTGNDLPMGQRFQASIDGGKHWDQVMLVTNTADNTVTAKKVNLAGEELHIASSPFFTIKGGEPENKITTIELRVVDSNSNPVASIKPVTQKIVYDGYVAVPEIILGEPVSKNGGYLWMSSSTPIPTLATASAVFDTERIEDGATVEYGTRQPIANNGANVTVNPKIVWSKEKPVLKEGMNSFEIRQTDVAGNQSSRSINVELDITKPVGTPSLSLVQDASGPSDGSGSGSPGPINSNYVYLQVSGLDEMTNVGWEFSTDDGASWEFGGINDGSGKAMLSVPKPLTEATDVMVRQFDAAGNVSATSTPLTVNVPVAPPTATFNVVDFPGGSTFVLFIKGTSTDDVLIDLNNSTILHDGKLVPPTGQFNHINATEYDGSVVAAGSVENLVFLAPDFEANGVDGYTIADVKNHIFSGEPGARAFVSTEVQQLVEGAKSMKLSGTLSAEEWKLLDDLEDFDMAMLDASVDNDVPGKPGIKLDVDSGELPMGNSDHITKVGTYTVTAEDGATVQFSLNGLDGWTSEKPVATEGPNTIYVRQIDQSGNVSQVSDPLSFKLDTTAPGGVFTYLRVGEGPLEVAETSLAKADVQFVYHGVPADGETFQYKLDDGQWQTLPDGAFSIEDHRVTVSDVDFSEKDRSIAVRLIDEAGNSKESAPVAIDSSFNDVKVAERSTMLSVVPEFIGQAGLLLTTDTYTVVEASGQGSAHGFANPDTLSLEFVRGNGNVPLPSRSYLEGQLAVETGKIGFGATMALEFYKLGWQDDTFLTSGPSGNGYVAAGSAYFAGGTIGNVTVGGFAIDKANVSTIFQHENLADSSISKAYLDAGVTNARIHSGGGNDVIVNSDLALFTIEYTGFNAAATDIIIGFESGTDVIEFSGPAAKLIDANKSGDIDWTFGMGEKAYVSASIEAVEIYTNDPILIDDTSVAKSITAGTLNKMLNLQDVKQGGDLLILANYQDTSVLFHFSDTNGNKLIDMDEYEVIFVADRGLVNQEDIHVIGTNVPSPPLEV